MKSFGTTANLISRKRCRSRLGPKIGQAVLPGHPKVAEEERTGIQHVPSFGECVGHETRLLTSDINIPNQNLTRKGEVDKARTHLVHSQSVVCNLCACSATAHLLLCISYAVAGGQNPCSVSILSFRTDLRSVDGGPKYPSNARLASAAVKVVPENRERKAHPACGP